LGLMWESLVGDGKVFVSGSGAVLWDAQFGARLSRSSAGGLSAYERVGKTPPQCAMR